MIPSRPGFPWLVPREEPTCSRRDRDVLIGSAGILIGMLVAFASCSPPEQHQTYSPTTHIQEGRI